MNINGKTKSKIGIIGYPLIHSFSPSMYNRLFSEMGKEHQYYKHETKPDELAKVISYLKGDEYAGFNVTMPYKEKIISYLDHLSGEAQACLSVNLVEIHGGRLTGYNTDGRGFIMGLEDAGIRVGKNVLFIGAGGASRSIAWELCHAGTNEIYFLDVDVNRAEEMADFIHESADIITVGKKMSQPNFDVYGREADMVINCSPVGMYPCTGVLPVENLASINKGTVFCDIIYNPRKTKLLELAENMGMKTLGGLPMFINQARLTLKILLGEDYSYNELLRVVPGEEV